MTSNGGSTTPDLLHGDPATLEGPPIPMGAQMDLTPQGLLVYQLMNEVEMNRRVALRWWHQTRELEKALDDSQRRVVDILEVARILHPPHSGECSACELIESSSEAR